MNRVLTLLSVGAVMAFTILGETPGLDHAAGFAMILAGVWLAARA